MRCLRAPSPAEVEDAAAAWLSATALMSALRAIRPRVAPLGLKAGVRRRHRNALDFPPALP